MVGTRRVLRGHVMVGACSHVGYYMLLTQIQCLIKFPTIILGMPHESRRIVKEKQQLMSPCSLGAVGCCARLWLYPGRRATGELWTEFVFVNEGVMFGLNRSTHEVRTAFCPVSNATWPYFWGDGQ
jgi:hypothetical protein